MSRHTPAGVELRPNVPDIPHVVDAARRDLAGYYAMIEKLDHNLGRLRDALTRAGSADHTHIIISSDHGNMHGSHGMFRKPIPTRNAFACPASSAICVTSTTPSPAGSTSRSATSTRPRPSWASATSTRPTGCPASTTAPPASRASARSTYPTRPSANWSSRPATATPPTGHGAASSPATAGKTPASSTSPGSCSTSTKTHANRPTSPTTRFSNLSGARCTTGSPSGSGRRATLSSCPARHEPDGATCWCTDSRLQPPRREERVTGALADRGMHGRGWRFAGLLGSGTGK